MVNIVQQVSVIVGVICFFMLILLFLRKNTLLLKYALIWLLTATVMLIFSLFPGILVSIARALGFELASNALFALLLGFVIIILLQLTAAVSRQSENVKTLIQTNALLEKRIRELEEARK